MEEGDPEPDLILGNSAAGSPCRALLKYSCEGQSMDTCNTGRRNNSCQCQPRASVTCRQSYMISSR